MGALLEVEGLCKHFGAVTVADALTFSLETGTCLGVIGPNGAGKTSLFNLIAGTLSPNAGTIRFNGREITRLPVHKRARLGLVRAFQIPQPFPHLSVYENLLIAACYGGGLTRSQAQNWAVDVLDRVGLIDKAEALAGPLSFIDRKRLELAKALASKAQVLLLDEIAGGLTEPEVEELTALISTLKMHHALMWIEHIPHALKAAADRILVLHFGSTLLEGPPSEVMNSPVVRKIYMGLADDEAA
jgi:branched-chain amino acid transport system ATP-binding protein